MPASKAIRLLRRAAAGIQAAAPRLGLGGRGAAPRLVPYRGFGTTERVCFVGRVGEDTGAREPRHEEARSSGDHRRRMRQRLADAYRRLISRPVPNARIEIELGAQRWETVTDEDGLFLACFDVTDVPPEPLWQPYRAQLLEPDDAGAGPAGEKVLICPPQAQRLVISDLDDTVIHTGVANKLAMLWRLFASTAQEREPFPGAAALYRGLHTGVDGQEANPILYVSRSPWTIYPALDEFFRLHDIPTGPVLLLRDWGITHHHPLPRRAPEHKETMIETIFEVYQQLPAVLVGDSGQRDPEIYAAIAERYPGRVSAIFIRDLQGSRERSQELETIGARMREQGVELKTGTDSMSLAEAAAERGWISKTALEEVRAAAESRGAIDVAD